MGDQKESLRKITHTLAVKNEEISNFICTLKQSLENLEVQALLKGLRPDATFP